MSHRTHVDEPCAPGAGVLLDLEQPGYHLAFVCVDLRRGRLQPDIGGRQYRAVQVPPALEPGLAPVSITDQAEPINTAEYQPTTGENFLYTRGEGGNEVLQIYRYDFATKDSSRLTTGTERSSSPRWAVKGERIVYTTQPVDRNNPDRAARTTLPACQPGDTWVTSQDGLSVTQRITA